MSLILLICIVFLGIYLGVSMTYNNNLMVSFCLKNGFSETGHELVSQLFFCYNKTSDIKIYLASFKGNYSLFNFTNSCETPQFNESKICTTFLNSEISCSIPKFKNYKSCESK